jgi:hypothetical protein
MMQPAITTPFPAMCIRQPISLVLVIAMDGGMTDGVLEIVTTGAAIGLIMVGITTGIIIAGIMVESTMDGVMGGLGSMAGDEARQIGGGSDEYSRNSHPLLHWRRHPWL